MENIDFQEILQYALRAQLSYVLTPSGWNIAEQLGWRTSSPYHNIYIEKVPEVDINVIVELDDSQQLQWIAVRGTKNFKNWIEDLDYEKKHLSQKFAGQTLSIDLHNGFYQASIAVWKVIKSHLNKNYKTRITGHSLGGAIAVILMMFCDEEDYSIDKSITFGQPKITNQDGANKIVHLPLLRVINQEDLVPTFPPNSLLNSIEGGYVHFGSEVQLKANSYVFRSEQNELSSSNFLWQRILNKNIKNILKDVNEHHMDNYLHNLNSNLELSEQVQQSPLKNNSNFKLATNPT